MLDFNKPVRFKGESCNSSLNILVKTGYEICFSDNNYLYVCDRDGNVSGYPRLKLENIPEEPKDHILLVKFNDGEWAVYGGVGSNERFTKSNAKAKVDAFPGVYKSVYVGE